MPSALAAAFLSAPDAAPDADLEARLQSLFDAGRDAWPSISLDPLVFARHLADRVEGDRALLESLHAADIFLACACKEGNPQAVAAFERTCLSRVPEFLARMRPAADFCDDVRQILGEKLLVGTREAPPKIGEFSGRGGLAAWLRIAAVRTALSLKRRRSEEPEESGDAVAHILATRVGPELEYVHRRYAGAFAAALRVGFAALSADQRLVLRLHTLQGLTGDQIASTLQIHRATVVRWIARAREDILREASRHFREQAGVSAAELESLVGLLRSQVDLSLSQLLG